MNLLNYNAISNIPLDSIEKIEIVRGSNATLYGAEAMGGVINIITKKASGSAKTTISGTIGNYTDKWSVGHQNEYFSVYYDKDYYDEVNPQTRKFPYGEYASSSGSKKNNYNTLGKSRKESIFITGNIGKNLTLNYNHSKSDLNRFQITRSKAAADKLGTSYKYDDNRDTASLVYDDTSNKLKSVFSFNSRWFTSNQKKSNEKEFSVSGGSYKMFNITSDTQKGWSFNGDKDSLIAGIAIKRDFYQNYKYTFQKSDRTSLGLYTSYTHQFAPKFSATLGLRGEAINDFDTDQNVFLPQLQTLYKFNENLTWYTNIGKSFIMPAMNSQFYTTDKDAHNLKKSRGLKPQEGWTYETGMKTITNSSSLKLAVFNMDISNKFGWASEEELGIGTNTNVEESIGPITIRRVNKERIINIQSNLTDRPLNEVLQELKSKLEQSDLQCTYEFTGQATSMNDSFKEMAMALSMSLLLIYLLLAVLYESIFTPLIRMFSLPLGIIGAIVCLLLTGNTINLYSLIGILVMDGLVAKNGTLLLDYTLTLMHQGKNALEAVIEAGKVRLKPIFMTALTMVVGMLPTALAMTEGSETRVSMAWVIIGGMITSTVFTLIVIPIIFL